MRAGRIFRSTDPVGDLRRGPLRPPSAREWIATEQPDRGPAQLGESIAGGFAPGQRGTPVILPGINYFPAGAYPVDEQWDADIPAGGTADLMTYPVPQAAQLRLDGIGFGADDETAISFLTWNLLVGGQTFRAYANQAATVGTIVQVSPIKFHVRDATTVVLRLTSAAAAILTYRFIVRVTGWLFQDEN